MLCLHAFTRQPRRVQHGAMLLAACMACVMYSRMVSSESASVSAMNTMTMDLPSVSVERISVVHSADRVDDEHSSQMLTMSDVYDECQTHRDNCAVYVMGVMLVACGLCGICGTAVFICALLISAVRETMSDYNWCRQTPSKRQW